MGSCGSCKLLSNKRTLQITIMRICDQQHEQNRFIIQNEPAVDICWNETYKTNDKCRR